MSQKYQIYNEPRKINPALLKLMKKRPNTLMTEDEVYKYLVKNHCHVYGVSIVMSSKLCALTSQKEYNRKNGLWVHEFIKFVTPMIKVK